MVPTSPNPVRLSRRTLLQGAAAAALATACRTGTSPAPAARAGSEQPPRRAYTGAQVYRDGAFAPATLVLEGQRIVEVAGATANVDAEPIDIDGLWLIPGFIDAHVHLQFAPAAPILYGGVTTVRDLGSPQGVAEEAKKDTRLRVLTAGRILTTLGGYPSQSWGADGTSRQIRDAEDAVAAVAEQVDDGASIIKMALEPGEGPVFEPDVLAAIVDAARAAKLKVTAHVGSADALALAIEHGVDELAHLPLHNVSAAEMVAAADAGMVLVPTLEIRGRDYAAVRALEAFLSAGGTVIYGTDLGNTGTSPGIEQAEVRALLDAGMSPAEVLDSATSAAAEQLGLGDVGRIERGAVADLVGLRRNPFEEVQAYDEVALVIAEGTRILA